MVSQLSDKINGNLYLQLIPLIGKSWTPFQVELLETFSLFLSKIIPRTDNSNFQIKEAAAEQKEPIVTAPQPQRYSESQNTLQKSQPQEPEPLIYQYYWKSYIRSLRIYGAHRSFTGGAPNARLVCSSRRTPRAPPPIHHDMHRGVGTPSPTPRAPPRRSPHSLHSSLNSRRKPSSIQRERSCAIGGCKATSQT